MTRPLRRLGTTVMVLVILLLANLTYIQVVKSDAYRADPNNKRTLLAEFGRFRGQIVAAGGVVLARSDPSGDQYHYQRVYPQGAAFANLTGYYSLRYGPSRIERVENSVLSGDDPDLLSSQFSDLITGRDPRGGSVQLTVVKAVQEAAYNGLATNHYVGAVVAIQPATGAILALATSPSFDPTPLASHGDAEQEKAYNALIAAATPGHPSAVTDRSIGALYPPGSTFKLVVAAAALQDRYTPATAVTGLATITLPQTNGQTLSNFEGETCGTGGGNDVSLETALAYSCNTAFAEVAMDVGADRLTNQATALGVDDVGGSIGLDVVGSRIGSLPDAAALAQSGIGQRDVAFTPLEGAVIAASIANHGRRMQPYLIDKVQRPDLSVLAQTTPTSQGQSMPPSVAAAITTMMQAAESRVPGAGAIAGVTIASKTGTAEHGRDPKQTPPDCWYVAFAPAENPTVAVAVLVENGGNAGLSATGATVAAPIGRDVIRAALSGGS